MTDYSTGVYRKGSDVRVAETAAEAVNLVFVGYTKQTAEAVADEASYRDLQAQAKELGIPANQAKADLAEAIASHVPEDGPTGAPGGPDLSYVSALGEGDVDEARLDDDGAPSNADES